MKRTSYKLAVLFLVGFIMAPQVASAGVFTWVKVGKWRGKAMDAAAYSETMGTNVGRYYLGRDFFSRYSLRCWGTRLGAKDWKDENDSLWAVKLAGAPFGSSNEDYNQFEIPDADGITIRTYFRYQPPKVIVDGTEVSDPFPKPGLYEEVAPDKIPGTADVMVTSHARNWMGVDIQQRVLGWSQTNHDDYVIYDWTFHNTGNVDRDDEIELKEQLLKDFYIMQQTQYIPNSGPKEWTSWRGMLPEDTVRIHFAYPESRNGGPPDLFGEPRSSGWLRGTVFAGDAILYVDHTDGSHVDEWKQPSMHAIGHPDILALKHESGVRSAEDHLFVYEVMQHGFSQTDLREGNTHYMQDDPAYEGQVDPTTFHEMPFDERGWIESLAPDWATWHSTSAYSSGPYQFAFGDSIRVVWAQVGGSISLEKQWAVGLEHRAETPAADWPADVLWPGAATGDWYLPPAHIEHPEIMEGDWDKAKDSWVYTGRDSLFQNAYAAQWNFKHDYNVPIPPPAPDVTVASLPGRISIEWDGWQSESVNDFAGYRVYRARGGADSTFFPIFECGAGTDNPLTDHYEDDKAERGKAYYYYVAAFDDGSENLDDVLNPGASLESGQFLNMTTQAASRTEAPEATLDNIVVVPNPFNVSARELQFPGETDKIMFMGLPPVCDIRIYTESGDLVKVIKHTNLSADEPWGVLAEEQSVTQSSQVIVSGIYIAFIEERDPDNIEKLTGNTTFVKFVVVR